MEKALNNIMQNGPKLRLGHLPAPTLDEINGIRSCKLKDERSNSPNSRPRHRQNRKREYKVPEHVKNPTKFTKYDLGDVKLSNGKQNANVAMDFLRGLKSRKSESEPVADLDAKIVFSRPSSQKVEETQKTEKSSFNATSMPKAGNI